MSKQIGRAWVFGNDVDTDLIYHNKYLAETDPKQMPQYAFEYYPGMEHFAKEVKPGDFVVAGKNFGCGSSREQFTACNMPVFPVCWQKPVPASITAMQSTTVTRYSLSRELPRPLKRAKSKTVTPWKWIYPPVKS